MAALRRSWSCHSVARGIEAVDGVPVKLQFDRGAGREFRRGVSPDDQRCPYLRCAPCGTTVLEALRLRGGGQRALRRSGAAAFLNTAYSGDYVLTFGQVHTYFCNGWKYALETWD